MKRSLLLAGLCALQALLAACSSQDGAFKPKPEDMLSPAEMTAVTEHARNFLAGAKRLKISDEEREIVRKAQPGTRVRYLAPKAGRISFTWALKENRFIIASMEGDFLSEGRQPWAVQIFTAQNPVYSSQGDGKGTSPAPAASQAPAASPKDSKTP